MRRALSLLLLVLTAVAITPAPGHAAPKRLTRLLGYGNDARNNPIAFTGDRVVFLNQPPFADRGAIESVTLSGKRKRLVSIEPRSADSFVVIRFDAAPGRLAYTINEQTDRERIDGGNVRYTEVRTGPLDGPYELVDGCAEPSILPPLDIRTATDALVHMSNGCERNATTVRGFGAAPHVRRLSNPSPVSFTLTTAIAGNFLLGTGSAENSPYGVYDHRTDSLLYEPGRGNYGLTPKLAPDGTLATVSYGALQGEKRCGNVIAVFSAAAPGGRTLPLDACGADLAISGGRLAAARLTGTGPGTELVNTDLNGGDARVLARFPHPNALRSLDISPDGKRVVWHVQGCSVDELWSAGLGDKPVPAGPGKCPLKLRSRTVPVRRGVALIPIACAKGCHEVGAILRFGDSAGGDAYNPRRPRFKPGRGLVRVKLSKAQLALVRRGKARSVPLDLSWIGSDVTDELTRARVKLVAR